jgi:hypothetical protein
MMTAIITGVVTAIVVGLIFGLARLVMDYGYWLAHGAKGKEAFYTFADVSRFKHQSRIDRYKRFLKDFWDGDIR